MSNNPNSNHEGHEEFKRMQDTGCKIQGTGLLASEYGLLITDSHTPDFCLLSPASSFLTSNHFYNHKYDIL